MPGRKFGRTDGPAVPGRKRFEPIAAPAVVPNAFSPSRLVAPWVFRATLCVNFCTLNIPTTANGSSGQNYTRINDPAVTAKIKDFDQELVVSKRHTDVSGILTSLADLMPSLPVDPLPQVLVLNSGKVGGFLEAGNPIYGPFVNLDEWYCKGGTC